jgi:hypothetical protein
MAEDLDFQINRNCNLHYYLLIKLFSKGKEWVFSPNEKGVG